MGWLSLWTIFFPPSPVPSPSFRVKFFLPALYLWWRRWAREARASRLDSADPQKQEGVMASANHLWMDAYKFKLSLTMNCHITFFTEPVHWVVLRLKLSSLYVVPRPSSTLMVGGSGYTFLLSGLWAKPRTCLAVVSTGYRSDKRTSAHGSHSPTLARILVRG